jgi:organic radical activating enzyme
MSDALRQEVLMSKQYFINEIFCSPQGEGVRTGTLNVFVRFAGCNLRCNGEEVDQGVFQPVCDTQFSGGRPLSLDELLKAMETVGGKCRATILTGGEPSLQIDADLINALRAAGWYVAIETNGTRPLPPGIDWVCVSPKTAEHTLRVTEADEVKYVIHRGQALPKPAVAAEYYLISPAFAPEGFIVWEDLEWCLKLLKENPQWRLSVQMHKLLSLR